MDGILHENYLVGISHITGGGIVDNTRRILGEGQDLKIDWNCWERPPIFKLIQELGNVPEDEANQDDENTVDAEFEEVKEDDK